MDELLYFVKKNNIYSFKYKIINFPNILHEKEDYEKLVNSIIKFKRIEFLRFLIIELTCDYKFLKQNGRTILFDMIRYYPVSVACVYHSEYSNEFMNLFLDVVHLSNNFDSLETSKFINLADNEENTPLMIASDFNDADSIRLLFQYGANLYHLNKDGKNAIDFSKNAIDLNIFNLFIDNIKDLNFKKKVIYEYKDIIREHLSAHNFSKNTRYYVDLNRFLENNF